MRNQLILTGGLAFFVGVALGLSMAGERRPARPPTASSFEPIGLGLARDPIAKRMSAAASYFDPVRRDSDYHSPA